MKEIDMQRMLNPLNMKGEHLHCILNLRRRKEDNMQRIYDLHASGRFYLHCRLHTIIPVAIDMQCVEYASNAIELYMHCM